MLKQYLRKRRKILGGAYRTWFRGHRQAYAPDSWWDESFFIKGLSDRQTIAPDKNALTAAYHYASVESLILRHLRNSGFDLHSARICDLGAGSGHWIDFYLSLGASGCVGVDVSRQAADFLRGKYADCGQVSIHQGRIHEVLQGCNDRFDLVNAVGIMFHLVDEAEWQGSVRQAARILRPGGLLVVGGHFGWLDNVNVQFDAQNRVNKRLRSAAHWKRFLKSVGFSQVCIYRNRAYLSVRDSLPENNVLIARKR